MEERLIEKKQQKINKENEEFQKKYTETRKWKKRHTTKKEIRSRLDEKKIPKLGKRKPSEINSTRRKKRRKKEVIGKRGRKEENRRWKTIELEKNGRQS